MNEKEMHDFYKEHRESAKPFLKEAWDKGTKTQQNDVRTLHHKQVAKLIEKHGSKIYDSPSHRHVDAGDFGRGAPYGYGGEHSLTPISHGSKTYAVMKWDKSPQDSQHAEMTHEEVLKKHGYKKQGSSNVFQHEGGHSVTVGQKGNWAHGKVIGGRNTEHTEGDTVGALDAHLGKFHWNRKTTHTNRDKKEILPVSEEVTQHAEQSDVTQFTEQVLPTAAVVPAMQQSHQFSEPFSTFGSRLAASKSTKKEG